MLLAASKKYTISVDITEGSDEFWESLEGRSGADEVVEAVKLALGGHGFREPGCHVRLTKFEETFS